MVLDSRETEVALGAGATGSTTVVQEGNNIADTRIRRYLIMAYVVVMRHKLNAPRQASAHGGPGNLRSNKLWNVHSAHRFEIMAGQTA